MEKRRVTLSLSLIGLTISVNTAQHTKWNMTAGTHPLWCVFFFSFFLSFFFSFFLSFFLALLLFFLPIFLFLSPSFNLFYLSHCSLFLYFFSFFQLPRKAARPQRKLPARKRNIACTCDNRDDVQRRGNNIRQSIANWASSSFTVSTTVGYTVETQPDLGPWTRIPISTGRMYSFCTLCTVGYH